jgi:hypothetical protein
VTPSQSIPTAHRQCWIKLGHPLLCLDFRSGSIRPFFRAGAVSGPVIVTMIQIENRSFHETEHEAWETIVKSFQCVELKVRFCLYDLFETPVMLTIATGWHSMDSRS